MIQTNKFQKETVIMKKLILMGLYVLLVAGTAQATLDIGGIYISSIMDYEDGSPIANPWVFEIWVDIATQGDLDHIDVTLPDSSAISLIEQEDNFWEYESLSEYLTLANLQAVYGAGDYIFYFENSSDVAINTITLNNSGISEPLDPVHFTYPADGATGISTSPTFTWDVNSNDGDALGMWLLDVVADMDIDWDGPVSMDTNSWSPDSLDPGKNYELEVSVFEVKNPQEGPALPTDTVNSDLFTYGLLIEYNNMIEFTTVPEPITIVLLGLGCLPLLGKRRS